MSFGSGAPTLRLCRRVLIGRAALLAAAFSCTGAARPGALPAEAGADRVDLAHGRVRGLVAGGVRRFLGIPYGHVPGRFRPAAPAPAWSGVLDAARFGPVAPQRLGGSLAHTLPDGGVTTPSSEQCLSVNVFAPVQATRAPGAGLPVLVWIHGGANVSGASAQPIYDGSSFARSGVVCVTFNYRLGLLGFLELPGQLAGSGNNALRDQILLLRWVRDNIAAFGGDPRRVTLAGESAGAKDVAALLISPLARKLFSRVIMESGGGRTVLSLPEAHAVTRRAIELLGLPRDRPSVWTERLLGLDTERLIEAQHALMLDGPFAYPLRPIVDGTLVPAMPESAVALGQAASVPMLLGTNRDESHLFLAKGAALRPIDGRLLSNMDPVDFERMLQHYDASMTEPDQAAIRWRALTAEEYWIPTLRMAEAQSRAGGPVWMYRFDKAAGSGRFEGRAAHVSELPYVWDNPNDPELAPLIAGFDPALAARMHAAWVAFISGLAPAAAGLPAWPLYETATRATMLLNSESRIEHDPARSERQLWSAVFLADAQP